MDNPNSFFMDFALEDLSYDRESMDVDVTENEPIEPQQPVAAVAVVEEPKPGPSSGHKTAFKKRDLTAFWKESHNGVHPLLFPNVITDVLTCLNATEVESCRLVCQSWNTEACKVLRTKRTVVFADPDAIRVYNNAMRNTTNFPHAQFEFCIQDFTGLVDEDVQEFWKLFGSHIRKLEFRQSNLFWRDLLDVLQHRAPNVETLTFRNLPRNLTSSSGQNLDEIKISSVKKLILSSLPTGPKSAVERLTDLLKILDSLEEIHFLPIKQVALKSRVSDVFIEVFRKPEVSLTALKKINLPLELNSEGMEVLISKRFPLEYLHLILQGNAKAGIFRDLCGTLRKTLKILRISFPESFGNLQTFLNNTNFMRPEECIQMLGKLKSLNMINFKGSVNFVQHLSKLEYLQYSAAQVAKSVPLGFFQHTFRGPMKRSLLDRTDHNLKSLKITSVGNASAETLLLDGISRCFPYLRSLHLRGVDNDDLGVIYRNLPMLSRLELFDASCTDQGITGISQEVCTDMVETSTFIVVNANQYRRDLFIGSLQFLKVLTVVSKNLTDASIGLGLVDCRNITRLKIGSPKITDTGLIFLTDKLCKQLDLLDVTECSELTEQSKFYAQEKVVGKLLVLADKDDDDEEGGGKKPPPPKVPKPESDRKLVKPKRHSSTSSGCVSALNKFANESTEFFEEAFDDDARDRRIGFIRPIFFHNTDRHRQRVMRIREALRRNFDFMRQLLRLGVDQVRQLLRHDGALRFRRYVIDGRHPELLARFRRRNNQPNEQPDQVGFEYVEDRAMFEVHAMNHGLFQHMQPVDVDEVEREPPPADLGPNRLPEFYVAEIIRLELHMDDVEYWLHNHHMFDREDFEGALAVDHEPPEGPSDEARRDFLQNPIDLSPAVENPAEQAGNLGFEQMANMAQDQHQVDTESEDEEEDDEVESVGDDPEDYRDLETDEDDDEDDDFDENYVIRNPD